MTNDDGIDDTAQATKPAPSDEGAVERSETEEETTPRMVRLGDVLKASGSKAKDDVRHPVYSVTKHAGFVPSADYFSKQIYSRDLSGYRLVRKGEFAYATIHLDEGSIGIAPEDALISPMYTVFRVDEKRVDKSYLLRFMKSPRALSAYSLLGRGAVHRRMAISLKSLGSVRVPLPSMEEQRRIVAILDRADAIRTKRRQVLASYDELKQSTFVGMFGDLEKNPMKWPEFRIDQVFDVTSAKRVYAKDLVAAGVPFLRLGNLSNRINRVVDSPDLFISDEMFQKLREAGQVPATGDILMTARGTLGSCYLVAQDDSFYFQDGMITWLKRKNDEVSSEFAMALFSMPSFRRGLVKNTNGSTVSYLSIRGVAQHKMILPPLALQREFARRVEAIETARRKVERALALDDELFASLQSRAFRGEL